MSKYSTMIDKHLKSPQDRLIAMALVEQYGNDPRFESRIESLVAEYASCMGRVEAGQMAAADVRSYMMEFAPMIGTAPDIMSGLTQYFDQPMPGAPQTETADASERAKPAQATADAATPARSPGEIEQALAQRDAVQDIARRREIEQTMRDNPSAYWRNPAMQTELGEIIARQLTPADPMDPSSIGRDTAERPMGGSAASGGFTVNGV
jgi:hypothetical protein